MAPLSEDIDKMLEEIKNPSKEPVYIYERNGGNIYRREFGSTEREHIAGRVTVKPKGDKE
jgi:hypothetical protein